MTVTINGATGIAGVNGTAVIPAVQGDDTNTGVFYPAANTVAISTGGTERMRINSSGQAEFTAGTAALPAITSTGDTNTGVFYPAADTVAIATSGTEQVRVASAGQIGIGGANYGTSGQVLTSGGASAAPSWAAVSATGQLLRAPQILTSGTSYTTPANCTAIYVEAVGGGGGGGKDAGSANFSGGGGGGGGGYAAKYFTVTASTPYTYAIGAGGATTPTAGGNTTFTVGATTITAGGGSVGSNGGTALGGAGGTSTNGDLNIGGGDGGTGNTGAALSVSSGSGGESMFGGTTSGAIDAVGVAGNLYGGGGSGGSGKAARVGGVGAAGMIRITEYT